MEEQPLVQRQSLFPRQCVVVINGARRLQHITAFFRKVIWHFHYLPSSMGETVRPQGFGALWCVARQGIAHLDWRRQTAGALFQDFGDVLPRMLPPGKEQCDGPGTHDRYDAAGYAFVCRPARASYAESACWCRRCASHCPAPPAESTFPTWTCG